MKKNTPHLLRISLAINIIALACGILFVVHRWSQITERAGKYLGKNYVPTEQLLSTFNKEPLEASNELLDIGADSTVTILFLGNSLTYTDVPEEELDKTKRGLVSSSKEDDYVHQLVNMIATNDSVNVDYSIINIADFERSFSRQPFAKEKIANAKNLSPDWLIVQVGENVAQKDIEDDRIFIEEFGKMMSMFPESRKIITIPFWTTKEKSYALTTVAIRSGAALVDLSHLGSGSDDVNNLALSQEKYNNSKAGTHPGDYGMKNIALCMYAGYRANNTKK